MIKLYDYWCSSASYRVRIALGLAGVKWDTQVVNLLDAEHKSKDHLARNPQGSVPVLEIDDVSLTQSVAIIEYLDETRELALLPKSPIERAQVRALAHAIAMEVHPVCNLNVAKWAVANSDGNITMESWMQHFITNGLSAYENMVSGGDYSYGDCVTLADICLTPQVYNAKRWKVDMSQFPKVSNIQSHLDDIEAFQFAHPDKSPQS
ncbi:MAG: maleylacetoacetate isomerase [Rhizobiales bacterium]|nr:maleylacetoacetate isomerase [Hyphomicrobiales bacterium]